jgi:uracil-DNA glycosylase
LTDIVKCVKQIAEAEMMAGVTELYGFSLASVEKDVSQCVLCALEKTRTNTVFGEGCDNARLMFVGEAPGRDEDAQARPFVGRAGKLLTDIIEAMGIRREDVYIANILKCRPPENRNPLPEEISKCSPYLLNQIRCIRPEVICSLGKFASQTLLNTETPISELRGKFYDYHGIKLMPTYHPAYLLRNPAAKKEVWKDMKAIAKELNIEIPSKREEKAQG